MTSKSVELFIGIDIGKAHLDIADEAETLAWSVVHDDAGITH